MSQFIEAIRKLKHSEAVDAEPGIGFMAKLFETDPNDDYSVSFDCAYKCLSYYLEVCDLLGTQFKDCGEFFVGFGRLNGHALFDSENEKVKLLDYRRSVGAVLQEQSKKIKIYSLQPRSFITYVN